MGLCSVCWGEVVVDKGIKRERECPFCWGTGFDCSDDDDNIDDGYED